MKAVLLSLSLMLMSCAHHHHGKKHDHGEAKCEKCAKMKCDGDSCDMKSKKKDCCQKKAES